MNETPLKPEEIAINKIMPDVVIRAVNYLIRRNFEISYNSKKILFYKQEFIDAVKKIDPFITWDELNENKLYDFEYEYCANGWFVEHHIEDNKEYK